MSHIDKFRVVAGFHGFVALECDTCATVGNFGERHVATWDGVDVGEGEANLARIVSFAQAHWAQKHGDGEA